jgi:hypothetical protein
MLLSNVTISEKFDTKAEKLKTHFGENFRRNLARVMRRSKRKFLKASAKP